ncbi:MAG: hypothetical protein WCY85_07275 [Sulfurimonas sp.]|jgi:hypothetical protein|nr:hypothetical protein [Sulfurimonas sp.]
MIKRIKIELIYFIIIMLILATIQHSDLLHSPFARTGLMLEKGNYFHPLLWTFPIYAVIGLLRLLVSFLLRLKNRAA